MVESEPNSAGDFRFFDYQTCTDVLGSDLADAATAALDEPDLEFWRMDSRRLTLGEWTRISHGPAMIIGCLSKVLHLNVYSRVFVPRVPRLQRFERSALELGSDESSRLRPRLEELAQLGFHSPVFAQIENPYSRSILTTAYLLHPTRYSMARVTASIPQAGSTHREEVKACFITELAHGGYLTTSGVRQDFDPVPGILHRNLVGARAASLWHTHQEELGKIKAEEARPLPIRTADDLWRVGDDFEAAHFDAGERRGLYLRPTARD